MSYISNLGYVVLGVSDLDAWQHFAVDLLGLDLRDANAERLQLKMDERHHRIVLEKNTADDLLIAGWKIENEESLQKFSEHLINKGVILKEFDPSYIKERGAKAMIGCKDPNGFSHEFYVDNGLSDRPFHSQVLKGRGFQAGDLGVGHILPRSLNYQKSLEWYTEHLLLKISDHIREEINPGKVTEATFFHTKTGRHHSLATAFAPGEKILAHLMIEAKDLDDVGLTYDRCVRGGYTPHRAIGRHSNDKMISFYVKSPSGFAIEFGFGGLVVDDSNWEIVTHTRRSDWGHSQAFQA